MKKYLLTLLGIGASFYGIFFFTQQARANFSIASQTTYSATSTARQVLVSDVKYFFQQLGTGFTGSVSGLQFILNSDTTSGTHTADLWSCSTNATSPINCTGAQTDASASFTISSTGVETTYSVSWTPFIFSSSRYYYLVFGNSSATATWTFSGSSTDLYSGGACYWQDYPSSAVVCGGIVDIYFNLFGSYTNLSATFSNPTNGQVLGDFTNWGVIVSNRQSSYASSSVYIDYRLDGTSSWTYTDSSTSTGIIIFGSNNLQDYLLSVKKANVLLEYGTTAQKKYNARVRILNGSTLLYQTEPITFTITNFAGYYNGSSTSEFTDTSSWSVSGDVNTIKPDCSTYTGITFPSSTIGQVGCELTAVGQRLMSWLFLPTRGLNFLLNSFAELQTKFPFSLFFSVSNTFSTEFASSTTAKNPEFTLEIPNDTPYVITAYTSTTLSGILGTSTTETLFNGILLAIIISFIFIVWHHVKGHTKKT